MEHKTLVDAVVTAEWEMFSNVQNVGGKASCQMDPKTFRIMRSSQMDNWDDELLGSYLEDLLNARLEGRNLVTEKYARMMESTFPEEYARQPAAAGSRGHGPGGRHRGRPCGLEGRPRQPLPFAGRQGPPPAQP